VADDPTTIPSSTSVEDPNLLSEGDEGAAVREIQQWLRDSGTASGLDIDGVFGEVTTRAVRKFEEDNGLRVDGRLTVGADDWTLLRHLAQTYQPGPTDTTPHPDGVVDPAVETGYGAITQCADGSYVTIVGSFESERGAASASQGFEGTGVLPSSSCPSLTPNRWLVVWGPFTSAETGSAVCLERGLTSRLDCYVRPIDFSTDFRQWDPDGTFHDTPPP
jgi:peptidoglycan hydrolase-like protein with peptidoglycan-binding domain